MRKAFTLIELLVVISIIALLIAILLPALSAARDSARTIDCLSRMRQVGTALIMYATEHQEQFPPNNVQIVAGQKRNIWFDEDVIGQYLPETGEQLGGQDNSHVHSSVFACPMDEQAARTYGFNLWASSDGEDNASIDNGVTGTLFDASVAQASKIILLGETWAKWGPKTNGLYVTGQAFGARGTTAGQRFAGNLGVPRGQRYAADLPTEIDWTLHGSNDDPYTATGNTHFSYADGHTEAKSQSELVDIAGVSTLDSLWSPLDKEIP